MLDGEGDDAVGSHGEDPQRQALAKQVQRQFKLRTVLPKMGDVIEP